MKPRECRGGILADEMGMSLAIPSKILANVLL